MLYLNYTALNVRIDEWWIEKDLEESSRDLIEVLPQHLHKGTEENHKTPQNS
jgi:hypothetical protein